MHRLLPFRRVRGSAGLSSALFAALFLAATSLPVRSVASLKLPGKWFAPCAAVMSLDGKLLFVAGERSGEIAIIDVSSQRELRRVSVGAAPTGLALAPEGQIIVTLSGDNSRVIWLEARTGRITRSCVAESGVCSPTLAANGESLYTCDRYAGTVRRFDSQGLGLAVQPTGREPICAAFAPGGASLAVASLLPEGTADAAFVRAAVRFLNPQTLKVEKTVWLPNGGTSVRGLAFHPTDEICAVVHNVARFQVPTTQVEFGWMNVAALSLMRPGQDKPVASVVLDEARRGAANPSCVGWSADGRFLCVGHAGTHEVSVLDAAALQAKLAALPAGSFVSDFAALKGIRTRIALPGIGPRALAIHGQTAYVAEFFSDSIAVVDLERRCVLSTIRLGTPESADASREGERLFNDATLCHQAWQSCASCHPDGRADGLNWDLLNDGIGNPKNTKSLLLAHQTPPAMSTGIRPTAEAAVRSGLRHILFAKVDEWQASCIDSYLKSLAPVPSPYLTRGALSAAALRGKRLFESPIVGCAVCHPAPLFTDLNSHVVNEQTQDGAHPVPMDTPTLVESWRTAPYLHDGSAATMLDVLKAENPHNIHGHTSGLSRSQIEDLAAYVLSL